VRIPYQIKEADEIKLPELIREVVGDYIVEAGKCAYVSADQDIQEMLSERALEQYEAVCNAIASSLSSIDADLALLFGLDDKSEELSLLMKNWMLLGSAIETSMQIFLAIYLADYNNSGYKKWENFNYEEVKSSFFSVLNDAVTNGFIESANARSLKDGIKKQLKSKLQLPTLYELKLGELIRFFGSEVGFDEDTVNWLHRVRVYRNCIHSFQSREVGSLEELYESVRLFCAFVVDLNGRTPDVDDYLSIEAEMRAEYEAEMRANIDYGDYY